MTYNVYTDGSFNNKTQEVGWAYIIIDEYNNKYYGKGSSIEPDIVSMHNYSGELLAAWNAISEIIFNHVINSESSKIIVHHDYEGVGAWPTGKYKKPGNDFSKWYRDQMIAAGEIVNIEYQWVKGHSGDYWNEKVDKMAKEACKLYS